LLADYLANNPRSVDAAALLGRMLAQDGVPKNGAVLMELSRTLGAVDDPLLLADLAQTQLALGRAEEGGRSARRAYALQRANGRVARVLARILQAGEDGGAEAKVLAAKARQGTRQPELARR
jgi:Flp pilus assembly protein TadD